MFVRDVVKKPFSPEMADTREAQVGRYFTIIFCLFVLAFALSPAAEDAIIPLASDGVALVLLYIPVVLGILHWEEASTAGAKWSLIVGFVFMQLTIWTPLGDMLPYFGAAVYGLALAFVVFYVVSKATESVPMERQNMMRRILVKGMRIDEQETRDRDRPAAPTDD
jgi:Na+/proline symporter